MVVKRHSKNLLFVHSALDEAGLDVYEFRVLCHISRRGSCFASLDTTSKLCKISVRKAQYTLKSLLNKGFILKTPRPGRTDVYKLAPNLWEKLIPPPDDVEATPDPWDDDPWDEPKIATPKDIDDIPFLRPVSLITSEKNLQDPWESEVQRPGIWLYGNRGLYP
jgi:hypothetical protein